MTLFVGSLSFISLPSFMHVSAAVSELRESNQNKKEKQKNNNSEIGYFQFNTFPGHIVHLFFNQKYLLSTKHKHVREKITAGVERSASEQERLRIWLVYTANFRLVIKCVKGIVTSIFTSST